MGFVKHPPGGCLGGVWGRQRGSEGCARRRFPSAHRGVSSLLASEAALFRVLYLYRALLHLIFFGWLQRCWVCILIKRRFNYSRIGCFVTREPSVTRQHPNPLVLGWLPGGDVWWSPPPGAVRGAGGWGWGWRKPLGRVVHGPRTLCGVLAPSGPSPLPAPSCSSPPGDARTQRVSFDLFFSPSCFPFSGISFVSACAHCLSCQDADGAGSWSTPNPTVWANRELCPAAGMEPAPCHGGNAPNFSPKPWGKCSKTIPETNAQVLTPSRRWKISHPSSLWRSTL